VTIMIPTNLGAPFLVVDVGGACVSFA